MKRPSLLVLEGKKTGYIIERALSLFIALGYNSLTGSLYL